MPQITRWQSGAVLLASTHNAAQQRVTSHMITFSQAETPMRPMILRYAWPAELDLLAGQAGLRLRERYSNGDRQQFGPASSGHVSVYE